MTKSDPRQPKARQRRPRASAVANRNKIIAAALRAFSEHGYDTVSTRDIAALAGMEQGHLAYYFPSKELLWREVVSSFNMEFDLIVRKHVEDAEDGDLLENAQSFFRQLVRYFAKNREFTRLMLQEFSSASPRRDWLVMEYSSPLWNRIKPMVEVLLAERNCDIDPAIPYFSFIATSLHFFGLHKEVREMSGLDINDNKTVDLIVDHILSTTLFIKS
ncbi:helix-turn-helix domain-containing protein [uncultured Cohaesibacter sp.]|uniref:TetR/AcrR family transcriptional regulator n=1 Tax=uncultured Cohaesibacter sp. TaxID=1002546 RepID=UPI00292E1B4D|nr:helix-turn-helix domain-containing protein [uncultured Cohaesibacter sp.]